MSVGAGRRKRFFCENCGKEVDESEELCPHCGAVFVAIKCPRCGYRGKQHHFFRGCPACGFLGEENPLRFATTSTDAAVTQESTPKRRKPAPEWLFWVVLAALILAFLVLSQIYLRI